MNLKNRLVLLKKKIPLERLSFLTGTDVGSWSIPHEWSVKEARIESINGNIQIDYKDNSMHLWQYSTSVDMVITREELEKHLSTKLDSPDAIPHSVTFYKKRWGFSLSEKQKANLIDKKYRVIIDTSFKEGELSIGQIVLPGKSKSEILIDAVLSSPSVANNLTGPVLACFLAQNLIKRKK